VSTDKGAVPREARDKENIPRARDKQDITKASAKEDLPYRPGISRIFPSPRIRPGTSGCSPGLGSRRILPIRGIFTKHGKENIPWPGINRKNHKTRKRKNICQAWAKENFPRPELREDIP
jgi:hypothetical protein